MTRRRHITAVLHNFLGTYTSRYSDYGGYWIFGMVVRDGQHLEIDLLDSAYDATETSPVAVTMQIARRTFTEQLGKARLRTGWIREARLIITRSTSTRNDVVDGHMRTGYDVSFAATAVSDLGRTYESARSVFVAPHDPSVERRSARAKCMGAQP